MNTKTCKAKGRALQNRVRDILNKSTLGVKYVFKARTMGLPGDDVYTENKLWPFYIECKNQQQLALYPELKKLYSKNKKGILVHKKNGSDIYATIAFDLLVELLEKGGDKRDD